MEAENRHGGAATIAARATTIAVDGSTSAGESLPGQADLLHRNILRFGPITNNLAAACEVDGTIHRAARSQQPGTDRGAATLKCFDCSGLGRDVDAVAVCIGCGAAVCPDHAHVMPYWLTRTAVINRTVRVEPPTRAIRCGVCQQAHDTATGHQSRKVPSSR